MKSHSFRGYTILVGGIPFKGQFAKTGSVAITWLEDRYTLVMGTDGEGTTEDNNNKAAEVVFKFLSSSGDNAKLTALLAADGPSGAGITTLDIVDTKGTTVYHAAEARLSGPPPHTVDQKVAELEWKFITDNLAPFVGGN